MKKLITEAEILKLVRQGIQRKFLLTKIQFSSPSAKDVIIREKIELKQSPFEERKSAVPDEIKTIAIGSDHTGYKAKQEIIKFLQSKNFDVIDVGTNSEQSCDYPDFAYAVAFAVKNNQAQRGIMIDATGIPSAITANKVKVSEQLLDTMNMLSKVQENIITPIY